MGAMMTNVESYVLKVSDMHPIKYGMKFVKI